jgi:hypothetical protein
MSGDDLLALAADKVWTFNGSFADIGLGPGLHRSGFARPGGTEEIIKTMLAERVLGLPKEPK